MVSQRYLIRTRRDSRKVYLSHAVSEDFDLLLPPCENDQELEELRFILAQTGKIHFSNRGRAAKVNLIESTGGDVDRLLKLFGGRVQWVPRHVAQGPAEAPADVQVPRLAGTILSYLYPPEALEGMLGDLEEGFRQIATKRGLAAARWWYRWQTARSVAIFAANLLFRVVSILEALQKLGL